MKFRGCLEKVATICVTAISVAKAVVAIAISWVSTVNEHFAG
jgi:hypothetical protein